MFATLYQCFLTIGILPKLVDCRKHVRTRPRAPAKAHKQRPGTPYTFRSAHPHSPSPSVMAASLYAPHAHVHRWFELRMHGMYTCLSANMLPAKRVRALAARLLHVAHIALACRECSCAHVVSA
eukprot:2958146-Pleurochrysis_carterae.AAC.3